MIRTEGTLSVANDLSYDFVTRGNLPSPGGYYPPVQSFSPVVRYPERQKPSLLLTYLRVTDSTSEPTWTIPITGYNLVRPRKSKKFDLKGYLKVPVKPRYHPPEWKFFNTPPVMAPLKQYAFVEPARKVGWSDVFYQKLVAAKRLRYDNHWAFIHKMREVKQTDSYLKWVKRQEAYIRRLESYEAQFKSRMRKYVRRLAILERRKMIVSNWRLSPPLRFVRPAGRLPEHYYRRETLASLNSAEPLRLVAYSRWPYDYYPTAAPLAVEPDTIAQYVNSYTRLGLTDDGLPEGGGPWANIHLGHFLNIALAGLHTGVELALADTRNELDLKIRKKILSKVRKGDLSLANIIGERVQSLNLFKDTIKRVSDLATGKKRLVKGVVSFIKNPRLIANDYLAFKFGVEPLLNDVKTSAEYLAEFVLDEKRDIIAFRANNKRQFSDITVSTSEGQYLLNGEMEISYVLKYTVDSDFARWASILGLVNPAEVAWELTPWSFVIDWLLPVQQWLEVQTNQVGLSFVTGTRKYRLRYTATRVNTTPGFHNFSQICVGYGGVDSTHGEALGSHVRDLKERIVLTMPPDQVPSIAYIKNPVSSTHVFESIALSVQRLFKR